ncbi:patatin-like phospholipase family protein [Uliginosibacterium sp. H1]|uniref:patatin-like phospholipase family protein n=1 Tax=Uliginosibacterium sp. H1 TaxID=3114757 RepID=UPI002E19699C|nr:patatin-like phospholipase family protein [Uliginosibacterium sp. H1]
MKRFVAASLLALSLASTAATAADRQRVGLVLGGGGARGLAHIGVLSELERLRVPVDCIAGTSAGALVGGIYAAGMPVPDIARQVEDADWNRMLTGAPDRTHLPYLNKRDDFKNLANMTLGVDEDGIRAPRSVIGSQEIDRFLRQLTRDVDVASFSKLPIPFEAVATDLITGEMHVFKRGDLAVALRASMAVPGVFDVVEDGGHQYIDGMFVRNLPVANLKECADVIIAVDVGTPMLKAEDIKTLIDVAAQAMQIATGHNVREQRALLRPQDVLIEPALQDYSPASFREAKAIVEVGRKSVAPLESRLRELALDDGAYARWREQIAARVPVSREYDAIQIARTRFVPVDRVREVLEGDNPPKTQEELLKRFDRLYDSGDFDRINYFLRGDDGHRVADVMPVERSVGPNYLRFGLELDMDSHGTSSFALLGNLQMTWLNRWGAQWRNDVRLGQNSRLDTEFYQPLGYSPWFSATGGYLGSELLKVYNNEGRRVLEFRVSSVGVSQDFGLSLGRYGELRAGAFLERSISEQQIGILTYDNIDITSRGMRFSGVLDQLDNPRFPRRGYYLGGHLQHAYLTEDERASGWLSTMNVSGDVAETFDRWSVRGSVRLKGNVGNEDDVGIPIATLGGFLQLSGLTSDQLLGDRSLLGRVMAYRQIAPLLPILGSGTYLGGSLEMGKVWNQALTRSDTAWLPGASAFVGVDTLLGPLYLGTGWTNFNGGNWAAYFYLGYAN